MEIIVTDHAYVRGKERLGISKKSMDRMANRVIKKGIKGTSLKGNALSWIINKESKYDHSGQIYIYGDKAWVYSEKKNCTVLVTILNLPADITKKIMIQTA